MGDLYIVVGHYGSGKTEFALNFAYALNARGRNVVMSDLDVVNPYFCSKENVEELRQAGIELISNNFNNDWKVDALTLHPGIQSHFMGRLEDAVVDVGGNAVGARVLRTYAKFMGTRPYEMYMVVNANRYESQTAEEMEAFLREIETMSGLHVTGLVNNTHMVEDSCADDVIRGDKIARELSARTSIPIRYTMYEQSLEDDLANADLAGERFPVRLRVRPGYIRDES